MEDEELEGDLVFGLASSGTHYRKDGVQSIHRLCSIAVKRSVTKWVRVTAGDSRPASPMLVRQVYVVQDSQHPLPPFKAGQQEQMLLNLVKKNISQLGIRQIPIRTSVAQKESMWDSEFS
jgi:hypothetical protein